MAESEAAELRAAYALLRLFDASRTRPCLRKPVPQRPCPNRPQIATVLRDVTKRLKQRHWDELVRVLTEAVGWDGDRCDMQTAIKALAKGQTVHPRAEACVGRIVGCAHTLSVLAAYDAWLTKAMHAEG